MSGARVGAWCRRLGGVALCLTLQAQVPDVLPFRVEQGETRYLSGSHTFRHMVIKGTVILTGDTDVTLAGPTIEESGIPPGMVFYVRYSGKIENELRPGSRGQHGYTNPLTKGPSGVSGRNSDPEVEEDQPGDGTDGQPGYDGGDATGGGNGWSGPTLIVRAQGGGAYINGRIALLGANGGSGGAGGEGREGGAGGHGGYSKYLPDGTGGNGSTGGNGGNGGQGGRGGDGGVFKLVARGTVTLAAAIAVDGGEGGSGGGAGDGGTGGAGGDGGYIAQFLGGGPGDGVPGRGGNAGRNGIPGSGGHGGEGGLIDIHASGDILYTGKPCRLTAHGAAGGSRGGNGGGGGHGGAGGQYRVGDEIKDGPYGVGINERDAIGDVGLAGSGGRIRLASRRSVKASFEGQNYQLVLAAWGGDGARPNPGDDGAYSQGAWLPPLDGVIRGGNGGRGGEVEVKAKGSVRLQAVVLGGNGNFGAYGQGIHRVAAADGARGGDGGNGGSVEVTAPFIEIDPALDLVLTGGRAGEGGYPGGFGTDGPIGKWGPTGRAGAPGEHKLVLADPAFFPQTSELRVISTPTDKAPVGKIVRYAYRFTNDDPESPVENLKLLAAWDSPYVEPIACNLGGAWTGSGFVAFPPDLPSGQAIEWTLSVRVLPPYYGGVVIPCTVQVFGEISESPGDDFVTLTLPMAPQEGFWFDLVPDKSCVLPGGERTYEVRWKNTNTEDAFTGASIELGSLPAGVERVTGTAVWNLGTVAPGASGAESFKVRARSPWQEAWGQHFTLSGSASAAELEGTLQQNSVHDVWIGNLGLNVTSPSSELEHRGNRVASVGWVSDCSGDLGSADVTVHFTTEGVDADTGARIERDNATVPMLGLSFDTEDAARLVAIQNTLMGVAKTPGDSAGAGPFSAVSVFFRVVHGVFEGSLPRLGLHGLPSSGQRTRLETWKADYPKVEESLALRQTDAVERLDLVNNLGIIAQVLADAHYPEVAEGVEGVISVWDLVSLFSMGVSKQVLMGNRMIGVLGTKASRMGAVTAQASDMLVQSVLPGVAKSLGLNNLLSQRLQKKAFERFMAQYSDDVATQVLLTAQWQLGSGKLLGNLVRNLNSPTMLQADPNYYVQGVYPVEIPVDPAVHGAIESVLRLLVEPTLHGAVAGGQQRLLTLGFSGSQDLALATGQNAKQVLQTLSAVTLRWGDLNDELHDVSVAAADSLMWMGLIPLPALQKVAGKASYVADAVGRVGAGMKVSNHAQFLGQLAEITAAGVEGIVSGDLEAFGYPVEGAGPSGVLQEEPVVPRRARWLALASVAARQGYETIAALYDELDRAAQKADADALADLAEKLAPLYEGILEEEIRWALQAEVLIDPPPAAFPSPAAMTDVARNYQLAVQHAAIRRMALMQQMFAMALGPDAARQSDVLAAVNQARIAEREVAERASPLRQTLAGLRLPDVPAIVMIQAPHAVETGDTATVAVTVANLGPGSAVSGRLVLSTPEELGGDLISPSTQTFQTEAGLARVQWQLRPSRSGTFAEGFTIRLEDEEGSPLDLHNLLLSVEEAGATLTLRQGESGRLTTELGTASLELASAGAGVGPSYLRPQASGDVTLQLLPVSSAASAPGSVRVGDAIFRVVAVDSGTALPVGLPTASTTLTLRWDEGARPDYVPVAEVRILMAESAERWVPLESVVNTASRTVAAVIPRAGWFTVGWVDKQSPRAPGGLKAEVVEGVVRILWVAAAEPDVTSYHVLVRDSPSEPLRALYGVRGAGAGSLVVPDHPPGVTRYYGVRAVDAAGNLGAESEVLAVAVPGGNGSAQVNLVARLEGQTVVLTWSAAAAGFTLESATNIDPEAWKAVPVTPLLVEGLTTTTVPLAKTTEFFRLKKP